MWPLFDLRWAETRHALGTLLSGVRVSWEVGDYPHFHTKRGYAVTFHIDAKTCSVRVAPKMCLASPDRVDGVLRHELGHVVDLTVPADKLDKWAQSRGVRLPPSIERRADAVAEAVWGSPIFYDRDLVQSTEQGVAPRPVHLGL